MQYEPHMRRAIELAKSRPHAPFAAVMVDHLSGAIVAEARDDSATGPTLHDVTSAIACTFSRRPPLEPAQLTIISTAEPCPMCAGAIIWAGIRHVVFGTSAATLKSRGKLGIDIGVTEIVARSKSSGRIEIIGGVLEAECDALYTSGPKE
jgi:tRNA(adenine34) deaminase